MKSKKRQDLEDELLMLVFQHPEIYDEIFAMAEEMVKAQKGSEHDES